jgi:hypothetical protein
MSKSFEIEGDDDTIVLRFSRELVDASALSRLLDYVERASIRDESQLTTEEARGLADEIDAAVWDEVKEKYTE